MVELKFPAHFPVNHLADPVMSRLNSFCANLLHSLIMWLIVSSLSPHSLHLLFCCFLPIFALIWLVIIALSSAAIRRDSVSLLGFPFLRLVQVFWCEMLFYYYSLIRAFHISVSRCFFIGVWVTASLLTSPGLFLVFRPFSTVLSFWWSPLVRQLPGPLVPLVIL